MTFEWQVPIVVAIIGAVLYFSGRTKREADRPPTNPSSGADLVERLQRTLGIAVLVESVEPVGPVESGGSVTIRATFMFGSNTTRVAVTGESEPKAWEELARAAIAWRKADYQHIPMWGGGG